ncbi:HlyD family efflux transporter periplasmic adaptor subunit [Streptomyces sp. B-S-A8]|uniref:HlyD family efflux transporter periplasmic adaptor subunit n=1 Tax=Streptomyces solicavernae TaxID=3043614 RepID=A0ABT6RTZ2_9ACTN|nr:HlyD family efflux transporter periplasmic adaptor subunit [Streptomyces sp. B-S-A8]MDI3387904.1 HlyD family efflux transporter periplasmic adaptor subunit [Streptomyces sp. B-S-A8]
MQFRQQALSKLQSPEELDVPVRYARPQGLLVLAVTLVVMAAASVWAVTGSVASTLRAPGVLTYGQGSYVLQSPVTGQVTRVLAEEGERLAAGAPVLNVRTQQGDEVVRTIAAGRVSTLVARIGTVVTTGADVASLERVAGSDDPLLAVLYVPADSAATARVGADVDVTVPSVPKQYGTLRGTVKAVGRAAQTRQRIAGFLGDKELAGQFTKNGPPVAVLVQLKKARTKSGYAWSADDGPPFALESMTPATGALHLAEQRPIDWLLP